MRFCLRVPNLYAPFHSLQNVRFYTAAVSAAGRYWRWLGENLGLTRGGRIAFTAALLLGVAGAVGDAMFNGEHGDQEGGVLLVFVGLALGAVIGIDAAFRGIRNVVRRFANRNAEPS